MLIYGENRAEFCVPKNKDVDAKPFFVTRDQMYSCYPDQVVPCIRTYYNQYVGESEMLIYPENGIHPHLDRGRYTGMDDFMMDIDEHRDFRGNVKKSVGFLSSGRIGDFIYKTGPFILAGIVLIYALITGGL